MVEKQSVPIRGRNRYRNRYRFGFPTIPMPIPTPTRRKKRTYFGAHPRPKKGANSLEFRQYVGRSEVTTRCTLPGCIFAIRASPQYSSCKVGICCTDASMRRTNSPFFAILGIAVCGLPGCPISSGTYSPGSSQMMSFFLLNAHLSRYVTTKTFHIRPDDARFRQVPCPVFAWGGRLFFAAKSRQFREVNHGAEEQ
jgi:hypothetical protein